MQSIITNNFISSVISDYIHSKVNTTHALTGSGNNIKFTAVADYVQGDTFTVNSTPVTAQTQDGEPLPEGYGKT